MGELIGGGKWVHEEPRLQDVVGAAHQDRERAPAEWGRADQNVGWIVAAAPPGAPPIVDGCEGLLGKQRVGKLLRIKGL